MTEGVVFLVDGPVSVRSFVPLVVSWGVCMKGGDCWLLLVIVYLEARWPVSMY